MVVVDRNNNDAMGTTVVTTKPATTTVCASAPGKVILFGEHAVVYGEPAIAAALSDLRVHVSITARMPSSSLSSSSSSSTARGVHRTPEDDNVGYLHIHMPDLPTPVRFPIELRQLAALHGLHTPPTKACADKLTQLVQQQSSSSSSAAAAAASTATKPLDDFTISALVPLLYLVRLLTPWSKLLLPTDHHDSSSNNNNNNRKSNSSSLEIRVRSRDLPVGAGLGSSAAFGVACAAALVQLQVVLRASESSSSVTRRLLGRPDEVSMKLIDEYAYYSEILLHGTPSGIDNAVSLRGGALVYRRNNSDRASAEGASAGSSSSPESTMKRLEHFPTLELLLVDTHVPRSTRELVAGVRRRYDQHRTAMQALLQAMGSLASQFCDCLTELASAVQQEDRKEQERLADTLLSMVEMNHHLLCAAGVSHPSLNYIVETVQRIAGDTSAAKLTGAGGGGCAMVLFRPHLTVSEQQRAKQQIQQALEGTLSLSTARTPVRRSSSSSSSPIEYQYKCFSSSVGGEGVLWTDPREFVVLEEQDETMANRWKTTRPFIGALGVAALLGGISIFALSLRRAKR